MVRMFKANFHQKRHGCQAAVFRTVILTGSGPDTLRCDSTGQVTVFFYLDDQQSIIHISVVDL